jgi:hypothetical protein
MALYSELPVFKASYDLLLDVFNLCRHFSKDFKYTIGEKLKNETVDMMICIYRANKRRDKKELLQTAQEHIEVVRLLVRLLKDLQQINLQRFVDMSEKIENVSKQLAGWLKAQS